MKIKRNRIFLGMKKPWIIFILGICMVVVLYNMISKVPAFFSDGYSRYKIQELELQNDLLIMQLGLSRDKIYTLMKNTSSNQIEVIEDETACDIARRIPKCDTIHVAMVCAGFKSSRSVVTLLKSILFYRKHPLHLHILVDEVADKILSKLFDTWDLPHVSISFYPSKEAIPFVSWIPNNHYSGVYGLLKLTLPKILPTNVTKIIVLDTDVTFATNIAELWGLFTKFNNKQVLGLVENQSNWYLGKLRKHYKPWPAIERGFNTGVILMNLKHLNKLDWANLWQSVAVKTLITHSSTALADQDIFNVVIKDFPHLVYPMSCSWNVQLSDNTISYKCYENSDVKVIHWNSPRKHEVRNKDVEYFRNIYYTFVEYNGNLLRKKLKGCKAKNLPGEIPEEDYCSEFLNYAHDKWRTHIFIREFNYDPSFDGIDVTLVVQMTINKLQYFEELCKHWEGPVSVTLYATDSEADFSNDYIEHSEILKDRFNIAYHVVYKERNIYPVNVLRNIGLQNVNTQYVFLIDINYLPMIGLYAHLRKYILFFEKKLDKMALIIPTFESNRYNNIFPKNKTELTQMVDENDFGFISDGGKIGYNKCYTKWQTATKPYEISMVPSDQMNLLVEKSVPNFNDRFLDLTWCKVSHALELEARGYKFMALPDTFAVHLPSKFSADILSYRTVPTPHYKMCLKIQKAEFIKSLTRNYGYSPKYDILSD